MDKLHALLKPLLLRRMKDDVEKSLIPKEETIVNVELTALQKKYYKAIYERNFSVLTKGTKGSNIPNLINMVMELRKCCNHPYLVKGVEDTCSVGVTSHQEALQNMINHSGKLVLIDKLLPKLRAGGHKVLIFSQMIRVLDILEDYLNFRSYMYERIDGRVRGSDRQAAIDRYSKPDSDRFVFLLCTRAGGVGINLTAADTVIIFDSDWNPQNDIQAQARCHRIGQKQAVKVYRLITRNTYEAEMFDKASKKLGLDKAVLHRMTSSATSETKIVQPDSKQIDSWLKLGAYALFSDENDEASRRFCEVSACLSSPSTLNSHPDFALVPKLPLIRVSRPRFCRRTSTRSCSARPLHCVMTRTSQAAHLPRRASLRPTPRLSGRTASPSTCPIPTSGRRLVLRKRRSRRISHLGSGGR